MSGHEYESGGIEDDGLSSKVKEYLSSLFHRKGEGNPEGESRGEQTYGGRHGKLGPSECSEPHIPMWQGRRPEEFVEEWGSLSQVEDPLDESRYPIPESAGKLFEKACGGEGRSISEKVRCVGDWVSSNIRYDGNHASLSREAANALKKRGVSYPMHRYMTSGEAWEAESGICGEKSEIVAGALRSMGIPSTLYRPSMSHFAAVAEDPGEREFYVYDATSGSFCQFSGSPEDPAAVVTKRWDPDSNYTLGVTPYKEFVKWNLNRRRVMGTLKACQLLAGVHGEDGRRDGFFVDEGGHLDESKLEEVRGPKDADYEVGGIRELYSACAEYLDGIYPSSGYYNVSADTKNAIARPPPASLIKSFGGREIVDLEHAAECLALPFDTLLGRMVEKSKEGECRRGWKGEGRGSTSAWVPGGRGSGDSGQTYYWRGDEDETEQLIFPSAEESEEGDDVWELTPEERRERYEEEGGRGEDDYPDYWG
jgi:hypothetical protein